MPNDSKYFHIGLPGHVTLKLSVQDPGAATTVQLVVQKGGDEARFTYDAAAAAGSRITATPAGKEIPGHVRSDGSNRVKRLVAALDGALMEWDDPAGAPGIPDH